jgi:flagellar protein FlbD
MIRLTKINGQEIFVNNDLIEFIESTPDTIISLTTGKKLIIKETVDEVIDKVLEFKNRSFRYNELNLKK